ncbi:MAG: NAD+ synthase [Bdellovibrionales bacterium]
MKVALAQTQNFVGDFKTNSSKILQLIKQIGSQVDLLVFPEGGLFSYPPKDYLFRKDFFKIQDQELQKIQKKIPQSLGVLLPAFVKQKESLQNGVFFLTKNKKPRFFAKAFLPNDGVFYESRYFKAGSIEKNVFTWKNKKIQLLICEDLWQAKKFKSPDLLICMSASPFTHEKQKARLKRLKTLVVKHRCLGFYLNRVGGQDDLIFDGGSFILNKQGSLVAEASFFQEDCILYDSKKAAPFKRKALLSKEEKTLQALSLGIKSFFNQVGFSQALVGLSGGIDSALVFYLATQALGRDNVKACFLPSPFTQKLSYKITQDFCSQLGVDLTRIDISSLYELALKTTFKNQDFKRSISSENIQARIRSLILMAQANEKDLLLLGTGNKSELATGYSTLYGDLCGALLPIGDLWKTEVYQLAQFISKERGIFSKQLLERAPSAELAPHQKDEDQLLPYQELDLLLKKLLQFKPPQTSKEKKVARLLQQSEFKRKQAPPCLKLSETAFGEGRRMPLAHKFPL